jgi:hypothetical protein
VANYSFFDAWHERTAKILFKGATVPATNSFYAILLADGLVSSATAIADLVALELPAANGYSRKQLVFPDDGSANGSAWELAANDLVWTFTQATDYRTIAILAGATSVRGNTTGTPLAFIRQANVVTAVAGQDQQFEFLYLSGGC